MSKKKINNLVFSSKDGSLEKLKNLLAKSPRNCLTNSWNALRDACCIGDLDIIRYLLAFSDTHQDLKINTQDEYGNTALIYACKNNQLEVVKYLLSSPELKNHANISKKNNYQESPLLIACSNGYLDLVKYLLTSKEINKHASILEINNIGNNALMCSLNGSLEVFKFLLEFIKNENPSLINVKNRLGKNILLMYDSRHEYIDVLIELLNSDYKDIIDIHSVDNTGNDIVTNFILNDFSFISFNHKNKLLNLINICISQYDLKITNTNLDKINKHQNRVNDKYLSALKIERVDLCTEIIRLTKLKQVQKLENTLVEKINKPKMKV